MKMPAVQLAAPAQDPIDPQLTIALAQASLAAYSDYEGKPYTSPNNYRMVARWTGWDEIIDGFGYEERFGLLFASMSGPQTFIFAFRGTDSDMDIYEDLFADTATFVPYRNSVSPVPSVASGFYSLYNDIGGSMTQSMRQQVFALLASIRPPQRIYVTGHSLGAALSQLFALDVAVSTPNVWAANMNFASPMVGLNDWQAAYESQPAQRDPARKTVRVYNYWDYVPSLPPYVPPFLEYVHVGRGFRTSFYVLGEWYPHELARHALLNLQVVLGNAVWLNPQVWTGIFKDRSDPSQPPRDMASTVPPSGPDVRWSQKTLEVVQYEQSILEGGKV
jgi:triacylglycerol lipase